MAREDRLAKAPDDLETPLELMQRVYDYVHNQNPRGSMEQLVVKLAGQLKLKIETER